MLTEERREKICQIISKRRFVKVSELSDILSISEVTVRRDLEDLHKHNHLIRTHGGAMAKYSVGREISSSELISNNKNIEAKHVIAKYAYKFINDNDTLFCDGSSTVHQLISLIKDGNKKHIIVITNSLLTANFLLNTRVRVIFLGGELNSDHNRVDGNITVENTRNLRADKCFIGINGIDASFGLSTPAFEDSVLKGEMIKASNQSFVLADQTKFGSLYLSKVMSDFDILITDKRKDNYDYTWLEDKCELVFAEELKSTRQGR